MNKILLIFFLALPIHFANAKSLEIALDWKPEPEFGGFYAAQVEGIFKQHSLDVQITPGGAGTPTIQVAAAGKTDFAIVSGEEILVSRSQGTDIVAIFSVYQTFPRVIMAHSEKNFKNIRDVFEAPGTLAVQNGLSYFAFLQNKFGKPKSKIVPYLGGITHFLNDGSHSQQAFIHSEPILARNKGVRVTSFLVADEGYNPYSAVLVTRKSFLEKHPDLVKTLVIAIREGWQKYLDHPDKTNRLMHELNPSMDLQTFSESASIQKAFILPKTSFKTVLGTMTLDRWQTLADQLKSIGVIKQIPNIREMYKNF